MLRLHSSYRLPYGRSIAYIRASAPHTLRSSASSFNFQHPLFSLTSSSSCLPLLPRLHVTILSSIFPSILRFRRRFLRKMWPIQLVFLFYLFRKDKPHVVDCTQYFISHTISPTDLLHPSPAPINDLMPRQNCCGLKKAKLVECQWEKSSLGPTIKPELPRLQSKSGRTDGPNMRIQFVVTAESGRCFWDVNTEYCARQVPMQEGAKFSIFFGKLGNPSPPTNHEAWHPGIL